MALLLDELQESIPRQWLLGHITIFADDIHVFSLFRDVSELSQTVDNFETIIVAIETLALMLSPSKSCVITVHVAKDLAMKNGKRLSLQGMLLTKVICSSEGVP